MVASGAVVLPILIIFMAAVKGFSQAGQFYLTGRVAQGVLRDLRRDLFGRLMGQSPAYFSKQRTGDHTGRD